MTTETITRVEQELKEAYGATSAKDGNLTLVKLPEVRFPNGAEPSTCEALVALDPNQPKPLFYVRVIPKLNGAQPAHGTAVVGGDNWCTYSYNLRWDENLTGAQFVQGMLRRFA